MSPGDAGGGWRIKALTATLTGLLVSLAASAVVLAGVASGLEPFVSLERVGADLGMRALWSFRLNRDAAVGANLVFIDVDHACAPRDAACASSPPVTPDIVQRFLTAAAKTAAAVVIIDAAPAADDPDGARLQAMVSASGPYAIAPLQGRPGETEAGMLVSPAALTGAPMAGQNRLRRAAFQMSTGADDGVMRRFATVIAVDGPGGRQAAPSVAYLAALLRAPTTRAAADCLYYRRGCAGVSRPAIQALREADARRRGMAPIVYSLPSLSMLQRAAASGDRASAELLADEETWYAERGYRRYSAQALLEDNGGRFPARVFPSGAIVILGASAARGHDLHQTPIGPMAGSEIILNAIRAFEQRDGGPGAPLTARNWGVEFWAKASGALKSSVLMLMAWLAIHGLWARSRAMGAWARAGATIAIVAIFVAGMAGSLALELLDAAQTLQTSLSVGRSVDLLTPILLLGLDGYIEGLKAVIGPLETWIQEALVALAATRPALVRRGRDLKIATIACIGHWRRRLRRTRRQVWLSWARIIKKERSRA